MVAPSPRVSAALATLQERWGAAAPRLGRDLVGGGEVVGALATRPLPAIAPDETDPPDASDPTRASGASPAARPALSGGPLPGRPLPAGPLPGTVFPTGFPALDAILGPGGVPRGTGLAVAGEGSSGRTTLALRLAAEAQAAGAIVAVVDAGRSFDPVEALARGVRLEWLVVVDPPSLDDGLAIAGLLLAGRAVDLLLVDLPSAVPPRSAERLGRLAALARRSETLLVVLEPGGSRTTAGAGEAIGIRLELERRNWIRLGRDVVGQRTEVRVVKNRFGPPDRRAELRILYAEGGLRDACLRRPGLLVDDAPADRLRTNRGTSDAPPPPVLASPPAPTRPRPRDGPGPAGA